jgi:outer membrane protein OmpA-like peptidoglycan-associated protein
LLALIQQPVVQRYFEKSKRDNWEKKMMNFISTLCITALLLPFAAPAKGQTATAAQNRYEVTMIPRTILAINYENKKLTEIGFEGSPLMPLGKGRAVVESKNGRIGINAQFEHMEAPQKFGPEYLTYVLWGVTPEGKANNLGEVLLSGDKSKLQVTTTLQTFGLMVTAEPFYAAAEPSDVVVLENKQVSGTSGTLQQVNVNYQLFRRGLYSYNVTAVSASYPNPKLNVPLELAEARNAVSIAKNAGAAQYAPEVLGKAETSLGNAEVMMKQGEKKTVVQDSRDAVQSAAQAVQTTFERKQEEARQQERAAAAQKTADAQAQAETARLKEQQEHTAQQQAELEKERAELQAQQAAQAQQQATLQVQQEAQARAAAEAQSQQDAQARAAAEAEAQRSAEAATQAQQAAQQLRAALLEQFNRILPTVDTPRGLKANISDVLFSTGKYELQPAAREALAKFSGIIIAHPGLKLEVDGYTDTVGSDPFNQTLSENRASSVKAYLINQGVDPQSITSVGYGKSNPVASNDTPTGRQQNRRVEVIISGEIIGTQIGH